MEIDTTSNNLVQPIMFGRQGEEREIKVREKDHFQRHKRQTVVWFLHLIFFPITLICIFVLDFIDLCCEKKRPKLQFILKFERLFLQKKFSNVIDGLLNILLWAGLIATGFWLPEIGQRYRYFGLVGQLLLVSFIEASNTTWYFDHSLFQKTENPRDEFNRALTEIIQSDFSYNQDQLLHEVENRLWIRTLPVNEYPSFSFKSILFWTVFGGLICAHGLEYSQYHECENFYLEAALSLMIHIPVNTMVASALVKNCYFWRYHNALMKKIPAIENMEQGTPKKNLLIWCDFKRILKQFGSQDLAKITNQLILIMIFYLGRFMLAAIENLSELINDVTDSCRGPINHFYYYYSPILTITLLFILYSLYLEKLYDGKRDADMKKLKEASRNLNRQIIESNIKDGEVADLADAYKHVIKTLSEDEEETPPSFQKNMIAGLAAMSVIVLPIIEGEEQIFEKIGKETNILLIIFGTLYIIFCVVFKFHRVHKE